MPRGKGEKPLGDTHEKMCKSVRWLLMVVHDSQGVVATAEAEVRSDGTLV
jgi:hypothetical protein